jgi:hypothetical protein
MSITRGHFLKAGFALLATSLLPPRLAGAGHSSCLTPAGLIGITEKPDGGRADMTLLLTWQLSQAQAVANLFAQAPGDPFVDARTYAGTVAKNWMVPGAFWNQLATALVCSATAQLTAHGLNATVDAAKSQRQILELLASPASAADVTTIYDWRLTNTLTDACGLTLLSYASDAALMQATADVAVSAAYMSALELKALNDPVSARLEASLLLEKFKIAAGWMGATDFRPKVIAAWSQRDHASPEYLATTGSWPAIDYLATFNDVNPLASACRALAGIDRSSGEQVSMGCRRQMMITTFHAEALAEFISNEGAAAGLITGQNWEKQNSTFAELSPIC